MLVRQIPFIDVLKNMNIGDTLLYVTMDFNLEIKKTPILSHSWKSFNYVIVDEYAKNSKTSQKKKDDSSPKSKGQRK